MLKVNESSLDVRWCFCGDWETPQSYEDERLLGRVYIPVGVFDDPRPVEPEVHGWISQRLGRLDVRDDLPWYERRGNSHEHFGRCRLVAVGSR
jgi:hypothetical protein